MADQQETSFAQRHHFVIRRLHSLLGLVPVGVFVFVHLFTNSTVLFSGAEFQRAVERIHALQPFLFTVEVLFIFLPLLFHALLGLVIWYTGASNASSYRYGPNVRYTLQRVTGGIAFLFIVYHVLQMHWFGDWLPWGGAFVLYGDDGTPLAAASTAAAIQAHWLIAPVYALAILATVFHLSNGIWTSLITWGVTIRPASQRGAAYVCTAFGIALGLIGMGALFGFKNFDVDGAASKHAVAATTQGH